MRAIIACIAHTIPILICLVGVGFIGAVIAHITSFIFINVFLAILGEAYSMVREKMEEEEEERKKAEKGRRQRTFGEWLKMLRAVWKARYCSFLAGASP